MGQVTAPDRDPPPRNGGNVGSIEHHGESPEAYFTPTPGLRIVTPSTPADAYELIQQAIDSPDPVIVLEPKRLYHSLKGEVDLDAPPSGELDRARVVRLGSEITAESGTGRWCPPFSARRRCSRTRGIRPRSSTSARSRRSTGRLSRPSARKTGRVVVAHEAPRTSGVGAELAARIQEHCFFASESPVLRVTGLDMPYPPSRVETDYVPSVDRVLQTVDRALAY